MCRKRDITIAHHPKIAQIGLAKVDVSSVIEEERAVSVGLWRISFLRTTPLLSSKNRTNAVYVCVRSTHSRSIMLEFGKRHTQIGV